MVEKFQAEASHRFLGNPVSFGEFFDDPLHAGSVRGVCSEELSFSFHGYYITAFVYYLVATKGIFWGGRESEVNIVIDDSKGFLNVIPFIGHWDYIGFSCDLRVIISSVDIVCIGSPGRS
jgi:hypothetical protein